MNKKLLRKKLALMLANLKKKRPYYCEVEYLETTNQQTDSGSTNNAAYIDTGIIPNNNTRIECRMQFTTLISGQSKEALNGTTGSESAPRFAWGFASISPYTNFYFGLGAQNLTTSVTRDTNVHTFVLDAKNKTCSIDNTTQSFTSSGSLNSTKSIYLFARHTGTYANKPCNAKIYRHRNWDNDQLVQDLIPVLDWNYTPCMYDKVTGQLFYNQGTGTFSYGREIHYVDYLESTGTQYIDTGVVAKSGLSSVLDFEYTALSDTASMLDARSGNNRFYLCHAGKPSTTFFFYYGYGSATQSSTTPAVNTKYLVETSLAVGSQSMKVNGTTIASGSDSGTYNLGVNLYLFGMNYSTPQYLTSAKLYCCKIMDGSTLVRDYIPAIDENGVGFMFDRVSHTIYDNAGTDAFKYPARQVEYIQSYDSATYATKYINTGVNGNNSNLSFELRFNILAFASYAGVMGNYVNETTNCWRLLMTNTNNNSCYATFGGRANSSLGCTITKNVVHDVSMDKTGITIDGVFTPFTSTAGTTNSNTIVLFKQYAGTSYGIKMRLYYCNIYNGGTPIRKMFACFKDGNIGMYDEVNNVLYQNAGTGAFTVGKIVEPEYE